MKEYTDEEVLNALRELYPVQADLARSAGVTRAYVSRVLNGHKQPSSKLLVLLGLQRKTITRVVIQDVE